MTTSAPVCPVCSSTSNRLQSSYDVATAANHFCTESRNAEKHGRLKATLSTLWPTGTCAVYECNVCTFAYGWPHVGGDEEFYGILHEENAYPSDRWEYEKTRTALRTHSTGSSPVALDFGAGVGKFLQSLPSHWRRCAVEGSETTRSILRTHDIEVYSTLLDAEPGSFDLITAFQVVEHVAPFRKLFEECRRSIKHGGRLVISVPFGPAMLQQEVATGCADMPPNHINKWTPASLRRALSGSGFEVERVDWEPVSLSKILGAVHLRLMSDAQFPRSLAAGVYKARDRRTRASLLALLAPMALVRLLPHASFLLKSSSFMVTARPITRGKDETRVDPVLAGHQLG
jgi:SAM-dependent methyltransferase